MTPDEIFETQDGSHSILSNKYGVSYHSKYGAIRESRHVFIETGLYHKALQQKNLAVLELGFGTGLNALLTFQEALQHQWTVYYEAVEAYPIEAAQASQLNYPSLLKEDRLQSVFDTMHQSNWEEKQLLSTYFTFRKTRKTFQTIDYQQEFDIIYFDAFAPNAQPELWELPMIQKLYQALREEGVLVTYCAKGSVKRAFKEVGFLVEALPGPPGKREMTRCTKG